MINAQGRTACAPTSRTTKNVAHPGSCFNQAELLLMIAPQLGHMGRVVLTPHSTHRTPSSSSGDGSVAGKSSLVFPIRLPHRSHILLTSVSCSCPQRSHFSTVISRPHGTTGNVTTINKKFCVSNRSNGPFITVTSPRDSRACRKLSASSIGICAKIALSP